MNMTPVCPTLWFSTWALCSVGWELRRSRSDHPEQAVVSSGQGTGVQGLQYFKEVNARIDQGLGEVIKIESLGHGRTSRGEKGNGSARGSGE